MKKSANNHESGGEADGDLNDASARFPPHDEAGVLFPSVVFEPHLLELLRRLELTGPFALLPAENQVESSNERVDSRDESAHHQQALEFFSQGSYFQAHEEWESIWRNRTLGTPARHAFQALIRLCAAGVKHQKGNLRAFAHHISGAQTHLETALRSPLNPPARWDNWRALLDCLKSLPSPIV